MHNNQAHPNILFIMVDQHRFDYLNCAGAEFIKTPNLDRLAERGIRAIPMPQYVLRHV